MKFRLLGVILDNMVTRLLS